MTVNPVDLTGKKILITGPTGQVALPVVERLAQTSQVYALARFSKEEDRQRIEALGATTIKADLADAASLQAVPDDLDYVLNFAVAKTGDTMSAALGILRASAARASIVRLIRVPPCAHALHRRIRPRPPLGRSGSLLARADPALFSSSRVGLAPEPLTIRS